MLPNDILKSAKLEMQFCGGTSTNVRPASATYLPIMVHRCPENFSTVEYFEVNIHNFNVNVIVIILKIMHLIILCLES